MAEEEGPVKRFKRDGEWRGYNAEHRLFFIEQYNDGNLISGISKDSAGSNYPYKQRIKPASFIGGIDNFWRFLAKTIRYPKDSRELNHQARVVVKFTISETGKPYDFKVIIHGDRSMDEEALKVVGTPKSWIPAEYYGKKISTPLTVPINFSIAPPGTAFGPH